MRWTRWGLDAFMKSTRIRAIGKKDPAKYEPQFGSFCAYAVSVGRTAPIDVNTFSIVEGRLVVQHNAKALGLWSMDPQGDLKRREADQGRRVIKAGGALGQYPSPSAATGALPRCMRNTTTK